MRTLAISHSRGSRRLLALDSVFIVAIFVSFFREISDSDIWFHMVVGRETWLTGLPATEFYVFTRLGTPGEFHEWGFGVVMYLVHSFAGYNGLTIFNSLLGSIVVLAPYVYLRRLGIHVFAAIAAGIAGFWLIEYRFVLRPETFLYASVVSSIVLLNIYRESGKTKYLAGLPVIGFLLAQCHPSALILAIVCGAFAVEMLARKNPEVKKAGEILAAMVVTLLISTINPYGIAQITLPVTLAFNAELLSNVIEFLPSLETMYAFRFLSALVLIIFSVAVLRWRYPIAEALLLVLFLYLAFKHARNIALIGLVLMIPLGHAFNIVISNMKEKKTVFSPLFPAIMASLAAYDMPVSGHEFGYGINEKVTPINAAKEIRENLGSANILNFYHLGNYLAWDLGENFRVALDGRNFDVNESIKFHDYAFTASPGWQRYLDVFEVQAIVTPATLPFSGKVIPLVEQIANKNGWVLAGREPAGLLFFKEADFGGTPLDTREIWLQAREELQITLDTNPGSKHAPQTLRVVEEHLGGIR